MSKPNADQVRDFFAQSEGLDYWVLRPLSHITLNWETCWDPVARRYEPEPESFAEDLNVVVDLIARCPPPRRYHDHEDVLAERVIRELHWPIQKKGSRWIGADYAAILENGAFRDFDQQDLISAASGRVHAAFKHGQGHVDDMEDGHRVMLAALMTIILYQRLSDGTSCFTEAQPDSC